ncbi:50S ribosomal protein L19e [Candidatus Woesearchaeota archaeon]|nr:MAG: 50S ribosomal protein L19e [Candidatus Woesearchaeota archaeon]
MNLRLQKRLAAQLLGCSKNRVHFDESQIDEIKEAITKRDIKGLINDGIITKMHAKGISKVRARAHKVQKRKGLQKGSGSRKGKATARLPKKTVWIGAMRTQRAFLRLLKEKSLITNENYKLLFRKSKGGFFRSRKHLKTYLQENRLFKK